MSPYRARQLLSRLLGSLEPPRCLTWKSRGWQPLRHPGPQAKERGPDWSALQGPVRGPLGASAFSVSPPERPASVLCVIEDASATSTSALTFAASLACRRRGPTGASLAVVLVCRCPLFLMFDPAPDYPWLGAGADVQSTLLEISAQFGIALRVDEISGWEQEHIIRIVLERESDIVILPMLDTGAGPLMRWRQRDLISALIARTRAVVMDEYDRPLAGQL
jgi:hypothetical protein